MAALAGLAAASAIALPAAAATMFAATGTPLTYMVHDNGGAVEGTSLVLTTNPGSYNVDYSSSSTIHYTGGGFAQVNGKGGDGSSGEGFADLTIDPENPIIGMSAIKFNLFLPSAIMPSTGPTIPNGYKASDFTFQTTVYFTDNTSQNFLTDVGDGTGQNRFEVDADPGQTISKITFSDLDGAWTKNKSPDITGDANFNAIKQVSFDAATAVPEPATWAMLTVGFGALGGALRRRRRMTEVAA